MSSLINAVRRRRGLGNFLSLRIIEAFRLELNILDTQLVPKEQRVDYTGERLGGGGIPDRGLSVGGRFQLGEFVENLLCSHVRAPAPTVLTNLSDCGD